MQLIVHQNIALQNLQLVQIKMQTVQEINQLLHMIVKHVLQMIYVVMILPLRVTVCGVVRLKDLVLLQATALILNIQIHMKTVHQILLVVLVSVA